MFPEWDKGPQEGEGNLLHWPGELVLGQVDPRTGIGPNWGLNTVCWNQEEQQGPAS